MASNNKITFFLLTTIERNMGLLNICSYPMGLFRGGLVSYNSSFRSNITIYLNRALGVKPLDAFIVRYVDVYIKRLPTLMSQPQVVVLASESQRYGPDSSLQVKAYHDLSLSYGVLVRIGCP